MPLFAETFAERFPGRAAAWQLRTQTLTLPALPRLMGIVNVTPDSFSDGGEFFDPGKAIDHALQLVAAGADLLDIGGESTRPYATPIAAGEELRRVLPVVTALARQTRVPLSIDTSKASVARAAIDAGAQIINDITALSGDPEMIALARQTEVGVCAMHMQGTPQTMQDNPQYENIVQQIFDVLLTRRDALLAAGISPARLCLDPGIGFGKTHQHNLTLAAHCWQFHQLGCPLLVGYSRKGFIGKLLGPDVSDRTFGNVGLACALALQGVQILRAHDVAATRQTLRLFTAAGGQDGTPANVS